MLLRSLSVSLVAGLIFISGCGIIKTSGETRVAFESRDQIDEQLDRLLESSSLEEIDTAFDEILPSKNGQKTIERLLAGWGKHGSWYDLVVVHYIWTHWPSYYGRSDKIDPAPLMPLIAARLNEQPELLPQLYWYVQWKFDGLSFPMFCRPCESTFGCCRVDGEEFPMILLFASAIRDRHLVDYDDPPRSTARAWREASLYFQSLRPFLRYDPEKVAYVVDEAAQHEGRYLTPGEQDAMAPLSPLPKWDMAGVPERPKKK